MPHKHDPVKVIDGALALGFTISEAVQRALDRTLSRFAAERGHKRQDVSMCLNHYEGRVYPKIRDDLADELGVSREQLDAWIDGQGGDGSGDDSSEDAA